MKDCEYFQRLMSDQLDEPLAPELGHKLNVHLKQCSDCAEFLKTLQKQSAMIRSLAVVDDGPQVRAVQALNPTSQPLWRKVWRTRLSVPLPVAASLLALWIVSGAYFATGKSTTTHTNPPVETPAVKCLSTVSLRPARPVKVVLSNVPEKEQRR
jgi:predicted anti-sigma-YlaC factor YlaD